MKLLSLATLLLITPSDAVKFTMPVTGPQIVDTGLKVLNGVNINELIDNSEKRCDSDYRPLGPG